MANNVLKNAYLDVEPDYKSKEEKEDFIAAQLSDFQRCVVQIRRISWNRLGKIEISLKQEFIGGLLCQYYKKEDKGDLFEGFLRLFVEFGQSKRTSEIYAARIIFAAFYEHMKMLTSSTMQSFILTETFPFDSDIFRNALNVAATMKAQLVDQIAFIFSLKLKQNCDLVVKLITQMLAAKEWSKAIAWIDYFNNRHEFEFEKIVCELYLGTHSNQLITFIGNDESRHHRFIQYFDCLLGLKMGCTDARQKALLQTRLSLQLSQAVHELELRVMDDNKRLERTIIKFLRNFGIDKKADQLATNLLTARCRDCLMYYHYRWEKQKMATSDYDECALMAMSANSYARTTYLSLLCNRGFFKKALYFALQLGIPNNEYPMKLLRFSCESPDELEKTRLVIAEEIKNRIETNEEEARWQCELMGLPIVMIDSWENMSQLIERFPSESIMGIDAEWKPNFLSLCETLALIQIAFSDAIYLVDVVNLEEKLDQKQWFTFFETLLCHGKSKKIGFGFANDFRVMCRTFPFIGVLNSRFSNVICLYQLLSEIVKNPDSASAVFGTPNVEMNLNLSEITNFFLNLEMNKTNQQGNWLRRPLRTEQKKYAALDALCLIKCFDIVSCRLKNTLKDINLLMRLQTAALVTDKKPNEKFGKEGAEYDDE